MMNGFLMALLAMKLPDIACEGSPLVLARRKLVWKASVAQPKPSFFFAHGGGGIVFHTRREFHPYTKKGMPQRRCDTSLPLDVGYSLLAIGY